MRLATALLALCAAHPALGLAQGIHAKLGDPEVRSTIGSPLWVRIPVQPGEPGDEVAASRFALGMRPPGAVLPFIEEGELGLERVGERYFLVVRSRAALGEPIVGLVIRERVPGGVRSREFTLLIDPPGAAPSGTGEIASAVESIPPPAAPPPPSAPQTVAEARALARQYEGASREPAAARRQERRARTAAAPPSPLPPRAERSLTARRPTAPAARGTREPSLEEPRGSAARLSGPSLKLTLSTDTLQVTPDASEEKRTELKMRRMLLDLDDLTAALLERQNRIGQLEKELAALTERMLRAEQRLGAEPNATAAPPASEPAAAAPPAAPSEPAAAPAAKESRPAPPAVANASSGRRASSLWLWLVAASLFAVAAIALLRAQARRKDREQRLMLDEAPAAVGGAASGVTPVASGLPVAADARGAGAPGAVDAMRAADPAPQPPSGRVEAAPAHIEFELPPLEPSDATAAAAVVPSPVKAATSTVKPATATTRRAKFLKSRYHDIAILNPPLDNPDRLLWQAGTLVGEGAIDFARRLLKFAAYSRQLTEEYWLALFELLYREKLVNDYVVNARWFLSHHPRSPNWPEVQRIGFLLDPAEPLFAEARAWSHDEPARGAWLPDPENKPAGAPLPALKLELAS
jgi:uncharacterized coiled-coil protein SlyX